MPYFSQSLNKQQRTTRQIDTPCNVKLQYWNTRYTQQRQILCFQCCSVDPWSLLLALNEKKQAVLYNGDPDAAADLTGKHDEWFIRVMLTHISVTGERAALSLSLCATCVVHLVTPVNTASSLGMMLYSHKKQLQCGSIYHYFSNFCHLWWWYELRLTMLDLQLLSLQLRLG